MTYREDFNEMTEAEKISKILRAIEGLEKEVCTLCLQVCVRVCVCGGGGGGGTGSFHVPCKGTPPKSLLFLAEPFEKTTVLL